MDRDSCCYTGCQEPVYTHVTDDSEPHGDKLPMCRSHMYLYYAELQEEIDQIEAQLGHKYALFEEDM